MNREERRAAEREERRATKRRRVDAGRYGRYGCACEWGQGKFRPRQHTMRMENFDLQSMVYFLFVQLRNMISDRSDSAVVFSMHGADGYYDEGMACGLELDNPRGPEMIAANLHALAEGRGASKIVVGVKTGVGPDAALIMDAWDEGVYWSLVLKAPDMWPHDRSDVVGDFTRMSALMKQGGEALLIPDVFSRETSPG